MRRRGVSIQMTVPITEMERAYCQQRSIIAGWRLAQDCSERHAPGYRFARMAAATPASNACDSDIDFRVIAIVSARSHHDSLILRRCSLISVMRISRCEYATTCPLSL
jgi:hypothetical protein